MDLHVVGGGKTIKQMNSVVYLGATVCEDGGSSKEIQRRVQAGAAAWMRVEGIMWDRGGCKQEQQRGGEWKALCVVFLIFQSTITKMINPDITFPCLIAILTLNHSDTSHSSNTAHSPP